MVAGLMVGWRSRISASSGMPHPPTGAPFEPTPRRCKETDFDEKTDEQDTEDAKNYLTRGG
jgi:hypothetical protein